MEKEKKKKKRKKIAWIVSFVLVLIIGFATFNYMNKEPKEIIAGSFLPAEKDARKLSKKERLKLAEKKVDASKFTLNIYPEATFEDGKSKGSLYIKNVVENNYPIAVQIVENNTKKVIYESGGIQPGYEVTEGTLTENLPKGKYKCTANVSIFDPKTKKYKGQTAAEIEVTINN